MKKEEKRYKLLGSLILFTKVFFKLRTGREFLIPENSQNELNEPYHHTISRYLTLTTKNDNTKIKRLIINIPPRYGKTELCIHYIAWMMARYPDSNFLYVSYSHSLAKKQTQTIRQIMSDPHYEELFNVKLSIESSAKDNFETNKGGSVYAAGCGGTITGRGAGLQNCNRFGGAIIIDDIHKPSEVLSETIRKNTKDWYLNTLQSRLNNPNTPIINIGQRLHEDDLTANLLTGYDGNEWNSLILKALNENGEPLNRHMHSKIKLLSMKEKMPYEFASQYQQSPNPAGGGIFKEEYLKIYENDPPVLTTFITADTAETDKTYNDATVFSFWGIYKSENYGIENEIYCLHWIDCHQCWIEPKDLYQEFISFYSECMKYNKKPNLVAIEKKSTGVTLCSILDEMQGIRIMKIDRNRSSGNKATRFINIQPYLASKRVSINRNSKHRKMVSEHLKRITLNNTHRYDDIADTLADAVQISLIDNIVNINKNETDGNKLINNFMASYNRRIRLGKPKW